MESLGRHVTLASSAVGDRGGSFAPLRLKKRVQKQKPSLIFGNEIKKHVSKNHKWSPPPPFVTFTSKIVTCLGSGILINLYLPLASETNSKSPLKIGRIPKGNKSSNPIIITHKSVSFREGNITHITPNHHVIMWVCHQLPPKERLLPQLYHRWSHLWSQTYYPNVDNLLKTYHHWNPWNMPDFWDLMIFLLYICFQK